MYVYVTGAIPLLSSGQSYLIFTSPVSETTHYLPPPESLPSSFTLSHYSLYILQHHQQPSELCAIENRFGMCLRGDIGDQGTSCTPSSIYFHEFSLRRLITIQNLWFPIISALSKFDIVINKIRDHINHLVLICCHLG